MILLAAASLLLGVACGAWLFGPQAAAAMAPAADWALRLLMLSAGISLGANRHLLRELRECGLTLLVIPVAVIVGSLLGGWAAGRIEGVEPALGMAIASGLGWYSLAGAMVTDLAGAEPGAIAFLSGVFRELLAYALIPVAARWLGPYAAIAPAASTSGDTSLPVIMKTADECTAVAAVLNGVLCSLAVPVLIEALLHGS